MILVMLWLYENRGRLCICIAERERVRGARALCFEQKWVRMRSMNSCAKHETDWLHACAHGRHGNIHESLLVRF